MVATILASNMNWYCIKVLLFTLNAQLILCLISPSLSLYYHPALIFQEFIDFARMLRSQVCEITDFLLFIRPIIGTCDINSLIGKNV